MGLLLLFRTFISLAQQGDFLIAQHTLEGGDHTNFDIISDNNGLICLANRSGIYRYDGDTWDYSSTSAAALSIAVDEHNTLYVGSIGTYGKINYADRDFQFQSLMEQDSLKDLFLQTHYHQGKVYFLGSAHLGIYDVKENTSKTLTGEFLNLYEHEDQIYVNGSENTYQLEGDELKKVTLPKQITSTHEWDGQYLALDFEGNLYIWNDSLKKLAQNKKIQQEGYEVQEAQWVNDTLIAASTFASGVIFLNTRDTAYLSTADYRSGLPDNEIYSLHSDGHGGVWVSHPFGLTSISPLFPAFSFSNYPGLEGNLTGVYQFDEKLWVTTSLGLYYFDQDTTFRRQVYYTKIRSTAQKSNTQKKVAKEDKKNENKSFFKRLFGKKNRAQKKENKKKDGLFKSIAKGVKKIFQGDVERVSDEDAISGDYERRIRKIPERINYHFSRVEGAEGKFLDLLPYKDRMLLIGNTGVYENYKGQAQLIIQENIRTATVTESDHLLISTADLELKAFKLIENDIWVEQNAIDLDDIVVNLKEIPDDGVWMAGSNNVYKLRVNDSTLRIQNKYGLSNKYLDHLEILHRNDTLYFVNSQGYFYFDPSSNSVKVNVRWKNKYGLAINTITDGSGKGLWINNGTVWRLISAEGGPVVPFKYLGLFKDLIHVAKDRASPYYWLITSDNRLIKYNPEENNDLQTHQLFVRKISNAKGTLKRKSRFTLDYDENFLTVELSKPDFLGLLNPEFQYKLEGLNDEWSDWTRSKSIDFSYLPPGEYTLKVRSRNALGQLESSEMFTFSVFAPYWQQPWFYLIQIVFFGALVFITSRLNQTNSANRIISGGLAILTLVLIIEFIQSAASGLLDIESTPVVDFLIDVSVAFLIFPLEKFLREFLFHGKLGPNFFSKAIKNAPAIKGKKNT